MKQFYITVHSITPKNSLQTNVVQYIENFKGYLIKEADIIDFENEIRDYVNAENNVAHKKTKKLEVSTTDGLSIRCPTMFDTQLVSITYNLVTNHYETKN